MFLLKKIVLAIIITNFFPLSHSLSLSLSLCLYLSVAIGTVLAMVFWKYYNVIHFLATVKAAAYHLFIMVYVSVTRLEWLLPAPN
jgi:hypothetical protein